MHIDKFAELNLIGFYQLASQFGGVEVCVNEWPGGDGYQEGANLTDPVQYNSAEGQDAGSGSVVVPGLQHLSPMQTLEFVRARHNLPQGDIDRTYRQQAVLDYVLWKLKTEGALADVGKLGPLLTVAKEYLAVPKGWNLLQFAGELDGLSAQNLTFHTLPSTPGPDIPGVGDVNDVNVAQIQAQVQQAFSAPPAAALPRPAARPGGPGPQPARLALARRAPRRRRPPSPLPQHRWRPRSPWTCTIGARRRAWPASCRRRWSRRATRPGRSRSTRPRARADHDHIRHGRDGQRGAGRQGLRPDGDGELVGRARPRPDHPRRLRHVPAASLGGQQASAATPTPRRAPATRPTAACPPRRPRWRRRRWPSMASLACMTVRAPGGFTSRDDCHLSVLLGHQTGTSA